MLNIRRSVLVSAPREHVSAYLQQAPFEVGGEARRLPFRRVAGDIHLRPVVGGTWVTLEEGYHLPGPLQVLKPILSRWLHRSVELRLGVVKEGAERLHRQSQLKNLDREVQIRY